MKATSIPELLAAEAVFGDFAASDLDLLAGCSRNTVYARGALLAREGEPADHFFVIRHGRVAIEVHAPGGPLVVDTRGPGEVVGWSWLFAPYRWSTDLRAVEQTRAVAIDGVCLRAKCDADAAFGYLMMGRFARLIIEQLDATRLQLLDVYGSRGAR